MSSQQNDGAHVLHRLPGTDEQQTGGLIIKKKAQAVPSDEQHVFKMPQIPPSTSALGLDKLAAEKRRTQSANPTSKRSKPDSFDENDDDGSDKPQSSKSRHLREQRDDTPSSTRSSHHDLYDKSRPAPKNVQRGVAYGNDRDKQRECRYTSKNVRTVGVADRNGGRRNYQDDDDDRYATPNIRGGRGMFVASG